MSTLKRVLVFALAVLILAILGLALYAVILVRSSFPATEGAATIPELNQEVEIFRDTYGIPHIYAENEHDLFLAMGYVHAQDRFWQMDFWRHIGAGRLAEMFGESQIETDAYLRTMGWARVCEQEWANASEDLKAIMQAYADGVNAYLDQKQGAAISLEYAVLGLTNPDYQPEPWTPVHSMTWAKAMAWNLSGNMSTEIQRATLLPKIGPSRLAEIYPAYPANHPTIVPSLTGFQAEGSMATASDWIEALPALTTVHEKNQLLESILMAGR